MVTIPEQFVTLQQKSLKAVEAYVLASLQGVERLTELNLQAARASVEEGVQNGVALFQSKDAKSLAETLSEQTKPAGDKLSAYARHVYQIANETATELSKITEKQVSEVSQSMFQTIDALSKNAPAGSEGLATFYKSAVTAANSAWDQVNKTGKQVAEITEQNVDSAARAAQSASRRKSA